MNTRRARPSDAEAISALIHGQRDLFLLSPVGPATTAFLSATSSDRILEHIQSPDRAVFVAIRDAQVVGCISIKNAKHVSQFFVHPEHQRQGIGRALWSAADQELCLSEVGQVVTVDSSFYAVPVYRRLGFVECGPATERDGFRYVPMSRANDA
jgi:predicted N-acetyltransferase YhbS